MMLQQGWYLVKIPLLHLHIIWAMYILRLFSSWGTSRICSAWSPSEHQLAPALSPIWSPPPKPRHLEEVVYSLNDSCSHFTQRLFLPNFLSNIHGMFLTVHSTSFISIIHRIDTHTYIFYLHDIFTLSFLRIFMAGRLPSVVCPIQLGTRQRFWIDEERRRSGDDFILLLYERVYSRNHCIHIQPAR